MTWVELEFRDGLLTTTSCDCADEEAKLSRDLVTRVFCHRLAAQRPFAKVVLLPRRPLQTTKRAY